MRRAIRARLGPISQRGSRNCWLRLQLPILCPCGRGFTAISRPARMSQKIPRLADFRRIVVKVGSSLLVDAAAGRLKEAWLASLAADIAKLHKETRDVLVVSSGAI